MKKFAFFIAIFVGLNATSVVRRPEEEEGQAIVQHENHPNSSVKYSSIIQTLTHHFNSCFYAISWDGIFHRISWENIAGMLKKQQIADKVTRIIYLLENKGDVENSDIQVL